MNNYIEYKLNKYILKTINNPNNIITYLDKFNQYSKLEKYHNKLLSLNLNKNKYQTYLQKYHYYLNGGKPEGDDEERKKVHNKLIKAMETLIKSELDYERSISKKLISQRDFKKLNGENMFQVYNEEKIAQDKINMDEYKTKLKNNTAKKDIKALIAKIKELTKRDEEKTDEDTTDDKKTDKDKTDQDKTSAEIKNILKEIEGKIHEYFNLENLYLHYKNVFDYDNEIYKFSKNKLNKINNKMKATERNNVNKQKETDIKLEKYNKTVDEYNELYNTNLKIKKKKFIAETPTSTPAEAPAPTTHVPQSA
jgi:hypothetical protein